MLEKMVGSTSSSSNMGLQMIIVIHLGVYMMINAMRMNHSYSNEGSYNIHFR
jgi:uncharacterized membrane protein